MPLPVIKINHRKLLFHITVFHLIGIAGLSINITRPWFEPVTPFVLLVNMALLLAFHSPWSAKHILLFIFIAFAGYFVEVAGVLTANIFGEYHYGDILGIRIFETPLIIGINWLMLIYFVYFTGKKTGLASWLQVAAGAGLMVIYDLILEPVAIRMDMWRWPEGAVPFQNYIAWFTISAVFLSLLHGFRLEIRNKLALGLFFIQAGFILSLNIIYRFI